MTGQFQTWRMLVNGAVEELTQPQAQENQLLRHQLGQLCLGSLPHSLDSQLQGEPAMVWPNSQLQHDGICRGFCTAIAGCLFWGSLLRNGKT